jgi:NADH-quinone oxidoreductase subunit J
VNVTSAALAATAHDMSTGEVVLFSVVAPIMVFGALGLLFSRKAVHAALSMVLVMVGLGVVYLDEGAPFLGAVQVFVYTGAVMMLFLFVIMLIGIDSSDSLVETLKGQRLIAGVLGFGMVILLVGVLGGVSYPRAVELDPINDSGNVTALAMKIFGPYVWAFEVTGALLITAALGAMVLAHRERLVPRPTQRELSQRRIREGAIKAPLPVPGVFARHNAVDVPALLPDGSPSELSISRVLRARGQDLPVEESGGSVAVLAAEETESENAELDALEAEPEDVFETGPEDGPEENSVDASGDGPKSGTAADDPEEGETR